MDQSTRNRLHAASAAQRGLLTREQCLSGGLGAHAVDGQVRRGLLVPVMRGVYAVPGLPPDPLRPVLAAVLAAGPGAVAAAQTAAALHGLKDIGSLDPVHLCVEDTTPDALPGVVTHRTKRLEPCDVTQVHDIPVTSVARTLIDLAAVVDRTVLTVLIDEAVFGGLVGRRWLYRRATALRAGRRGVGVIVMLTADDADARFRSWLERRAAFVITEAGLPEPLWNEPVRAGGRLIGIADTCWPRERLVVEFDGLRFHSTPEQRRADAEREREFVLAGLRLLRFTWRDVVETPEVVVYALHRALTRGVSGSLTIGTAT